MKIKWLGHAAFSISGDDGPAIVTDPYRPGAFNGAISYAPITGKFDIATVSHKHADHDGVDELASNPAVVDTEGRIEAKGISFEGIRTYHDEAKGSKRGLNIIFCFEVDGIRVCHLGDLGHIPDEKTMAKLANVDVLLIPVGGTFTIGPKDALKLIKKVAPKVAIPMHYKTPKVGFDLAPLVEFTSGVDNVTVSDSSEVEFTTRSLPQQTQVIVLKHAN